MQKLSFALVLVAATGIASAESLKSTILRVDKAAEKAIAAKNIDAFVKAVKPNVTPDFVYEENGQKQTFDQMVAGMKMGFAAITKVTISKATVKSVSEKGNKGVSQSVHTMGGEMIGPDKKKHVMVYSGETEETHVKVNGKWLMSKMTWKKTTMTMDGKPFDPSKMQGGAGR